MAFVVGRLLLAVVDHVTALDGCAFQSVAQTYRHASFPLSRSDDVSSRVGSLARASRARRRSISAAASCWIGGVSCCLQPNSGSPFGMVGPHAYFPARRSHRSLLILTSLPRNGS